MKKSVCLIIIALLLTGCMSSAEAPTSDRSALPTLTAITTSVPTPTKPPTPISIAPTVIISITPTPSLTSTVIPPNLASLLTAQVSWDICNGATEPNYETDLSPDGNWLAVQCHSVSEFIGTKISRLDGTLIWLVSFCEFYGKYQDIKD